MKPATPTPWPKGAAIVFVALVWVLIFFAAFDILGGPNPNQPTREEAQSIE